VQKNCNIKPKIRRKAKKSPDIWRGQHQALKVQQAIIDCSDYIKMVQKAREIKVFRAFAISKQADMV